jgi:hypothetical protein
MVWTWQYLDAEGQAVEVPDTEDFSSQSDAETWLGQAWRELAEAGVVSVTLLDDDRSEYTMSLEAPE